MYTVTITRFVFTNSMISFEASVSSDPLMISVRETGPGHRSRCFLMWNILSRLENKLFEWNYVTVKVNVILVKGFWTSRLSRNKRIQYKAFERSVYTSNREKPWTSSTFGKRKKFCYPYKISVSNLNNYVQSLQLIQKNYIQQRDSCPYHNPPFRWTISCHPPNNSFVLEIDSVW